MNDGFILLAGPAAALKDSLSRSHLGRQWLDQRQPQAFHPGSAVLAARLKMAQPPWQITPVAFEGALFAGRLYQPRREGEPAVNSLLGAWREHGRLAQARLNGEYAFCMQDSQPGLLRAGTDLFGQRSLYYLQQPDFGVISSSIAAILAFWGSSLPLNEHAIARFLRPLSSSCQDEGDTFFAGLRMLRGGECVTFDPVQNSFELAQVDFPLHLLQPLQAGPADLGEALAQALREALAERSATGQLALALSGGIDSALLAVQIAQLQRSSSLRACAITSVLPGPVGAEEARCAALTASACGIELIRMPRDPGPVRLPLTSPLAWAEQPLSLCDDLSQVRRLMAIGQPAISGLGSDELLATGRRRPGLRRSIVGRLKRKLVRRRPSPPVPAAVAADLQALLDDREQAWVAPALRSEASSGAETQDAAAVVWTDLLLPNGGFRTDVEARDGAGLFRAEVSLPFLDHRVVALMLDPQLAQADIERWPNSPGKQFLRRMLQGQVPGAVWQRSKQPAGQPTFQRFAELELAMARNQLALIPGLDRYVCLNKLPEIDVDRPWSTLYPVLACTSLGSWLFHHSGVEQQWQVIRMQ